MNKNLSLKKRFFLFVLLPTFIAAFYYAIWASDMYVSEARFSIRSSESSTPFDPLEIFGQGSAGTKGDAYVVEGYIHSIGLLKTLDERLQLRQHYASTDADFFSRLKLTASIEDFYDYFSKVVQVTFDPTTSIISLSVRAFSPEMAQDLGQAIIDQSELLINHLNERALQDSLALARSELTTAEQNVMDIRSELTLLRQRNELINPEASAGAILSLITELEGEAVKARTQMAEISSFMRADSTQVAALKARVAALEAQIKAEKARIAGTESNVLNEVLADYEKLMVEREFAEQRYLSAMSALESSRLRAEEKSRYLVAFSPATLPEDSLWPRRLSFTALVFAGATLLFGIVSLIIAAIREHTGV